MNSKGGKLGAVRGRGRHRRTMAVSLSLGAALLLAACSDSNDDNTPAAAGDSASTTACLDAANKFMQPYDQLPTTLPASYTPLKSKPQAGGTVIQIDGPLPQEQVDAWNALQEAAKSVGWTAKKISYNGSIEDFNAKFAQAVSEKPTVILEQGIEPATFSKPLADAKAAGIVVGATGISTLPDSNPGFASLADGAKAFKGSGLLNANMFMRDSGCKGSVAIIDLPFPIGKAAVDPFQETVKLQCPDCKITYRQLQFADVGTPAATTAIVSLLQSNRDIKYVFATIGDSVNGLNTALTQAGISGIKIFGGSPNAIAYKALKDGSNAWWINQSAQLNAWTEFDAALRAVDSKAVHQEFDEFPLAVVTSENAPEDPTDVPIGYREAFKKLWLAE